LAYCINRERDEVEFNFSIPKYLYGNNVMQFIPHALSPYYKKWFQGNFLHRPYTPQKFVHFSDDYLRRFLDIFFMREFSYIPDGRDVQITRIDIAFNLIMNTRLELKTFLANVKTHRKLRFRDSSELSFRDGGITYVTSRWSFKIYDKGLEFKKNDYKILKKNPPTGCDVEDLYAIAQRTARFECTYRDSMFNYLVKQESPEHMKGKKNQKAYDRSRDKMDDFYIIGDSYESDQRTFDAILQQKLHKHFLAVVKEYIPRTIGEADYDLLVYNLNAKYRDAPKRLISAHKLKVFLNLLRIYDWTEIMDMNIFPRAILYRYRAFMNENGYRIDTKIADRDFDISFEIYYTCVSFFNFKNQKLI